jgi:hypothetical protein
MSMAATRRTPLLFAWILLVSAGAGCLGGGIQEGAGAARGDLDEDSAGTIEIPWGLESCRASWWLAPASSEALREYLPDGFEPAPTPQLPGMDVVAGLDTYLGFDAFECRSGAGLNGTLEPIIFGSLFTRVTPPEDYAVQGLDGSYFFRWEVLVADQPRFDHLAALGLAVRMGDAKVEAQTAVGSPGAWQSTLALDGSGTFTFTGSTTGPEAAGDDVPYAAYTPAAHDVATWQATATDLTAAFGWGAWTVEPGSWVADVLGAEQGAGPFSVGTWSISDASLLIPGPQAAAEP